MAHVLRSPSLYARSSSNFSTMHRMSSPFSLHFLSLLRLSSFLGHSPHMCFSLCSYSPFCIIDGTTCFSTSYLHLAFDLHQLRRLPQIVPYCLIASDLHSMCLHREYGIWDALNIPLRYVVDCPYPCLDHSITVAYLQRTSCSTIRKTALWRYTFLLLYRWLSLFRSR